MEDLLSFPSDEKQKKREEKKKKKERTRMHVGSEFGPVSQQ
jgi:hypothetical protein